MGETRQFGTPTLFLLIAIVGLAISLVLSQMNCSHLRKELNQLKDYQARRIEVQSKYDSAIDALSQAESQLGSDHPKTIELLERSDELKTELVSGRLLEDGRWIMDRIRR